MGYQSTFPATIQGWACPCSHTIVEVQAFNALRPREKQQVKLPERIVEEPSNKAREIENHEY